MLRVGFLVSLNLLRKKEILNVSCLDRIEKWKTVPVPPLKRLGQTCPVSHVSSHQIKTRKSINPVKFSGLHCSWVLCENAEIQELKVYNCNWVKLWFLFLLLLLFVLSFQLNSLVRLTKSREVILKSFMSTSSYWSTRLGLRVQSV